MSVADARKLSMTDCTGGIIPNSNLHRRLDKGSTAVILDGSTPAPLLMELFRTWRCHDHS